MARRLCEICYSRWHKRGQLDKWPTMSQRGVATYSLEKAVPIERARTYRDLTTGPGALNRKRACRVLGITVRTAYRYEAWLRGQAASKESEDK